MKLNDTVIVFQNVNRMLNSFLRTYLSWHEDDDDDDDDAAVFMSSAFAIVINK